MPDLADVAERVWYGAGAGAAVARAALAPLELLFRGATAVRGALYDAGALARPEPALPAASVGNLTVGGTGKTPVAAWVSAWLRDHGARPALVLRGVGDDEPRVHALLNPDVPVIAGADRVAGIIRARALGADVVVLDDAFQHRRARRDIDLVLVSAERFARPVRLLPAGPYREGLTALARASAVVVTRKVASPGVAEAALARLRRARPELPLVLVHLAADEVRRWSDVERNGAHPASPLRGERVLAVAGVAEPAAFVAQLEAAGAAIDAAFFRDHHAYDAADVATLARRAERAERVVTTLKDAVKLGPRWPRGAPPLWYVSQRVVVERGGEVFEQQLGRLLRLALAARQSAASDPAAARRLE